MTTRRRLILIICVAAAVSASLGAAVFAADSVKPAGSNVIVNLEAKNISVKAAIEQMFKGTGLSYQIKPGVEGTVVELRLKGVTIDQALKAIADEAGLTVVLDKGIYIISVPTQVSLGRVPQQTTSAVVEQLAPLPEVAQNAVPGTDQTQATPTDQSAAALADTGPVYYGQPGDVAYPYGYTGPPPAFQYGNVSILGGYTPIVISSADRPVVSTTSSPIPFQPVSPSPFMPSPYRPFPVAAPFGW